MLPSKLLSPAYVAVRLFAPTLVKDKESWKAEGKPFAVDMLSAMGLQNSVARPVAQRLAAYGTNLNFAEYGLDKPVPEQYWIYMTGLLRGDLGFSIRTRRPVVQDLSEFFPATFELSLTALLISLVIGIPTGIWSSLFRNRLPDHAVRIFALIGGSLPIFWLGLLLIGLFYSNLGWLPSGGRIDDFIPPPQHITGLFVLDSLLTGNVIALQNSLLHLVLPAFTLGYFSTAVISRMTSSGGHG